MSKSNFFHIVLEQNDEDLLEILAIFCTHNLLNLGGFDIVLIVDLELLKPGQEILNFVFDLKFPHDFFNDLVIGIDFQYVLEKDSQQV